MNCSKCSNPAITFIRYSGQHLCEVHFTDFTEKRVKKELRRQLNIKKETKVAIAVSGGKDSSVATHLLSKILGQSSKVEFVAITVDEGIAAYRPKGIVAAKHLCNKMNIPHHTVAFKDLLGWTMDHVSEVDPDTIPCTYCGVFRRYVLNKKAREISADYLATGLNLDDTAQSILMNVARGDLERMARLGPHERLKEDIVPRLQPLRVVPEKETYLYAMINEIGFHDATCPYSDRAVRGLFRNALNNLESEIPGTRHSLLSSFDQMKPWLEREFSSSKVKKCERCGEPTIKTVCKACELVSTLNSKVT